MRNVAADARERAAGGLVDSSVGRYSEADLTGLGRIRKSLRGEGQV